MTSHFDCHPLRIGRVDLPAVEVLAVEEGLPLQGAELEVAKLDPAVRGVGNGEPDFGDSVTEQRPSLVSGFPGSPAKSRLLGVDRMPKFCHPSRSPGFNEQGK